MQEKKKIPLLGAMKALRIMSAMAITAFLLAGMTDPTITTRVAGDGIERPVGASHTKTTAAMKAAMMKNPDSPGN